MSFFYPQNIDFCCLTQSQKLWPLAEFLFLNIGSGYVGGCAVCIYLPWSSSHCPWGLLD